MTDHRKRRVSREKNIFFEVLRRSIPTDTTLFKPPIFGGFRLATVRVATGTRPTQRTKLRGQESCRPLRRWLRRGGRPNEPRLRRGISLEEIEQKARDLGAAGLAGMGAVGREIPRLVSQGTHGTRRGAIGPEIRAPEEQRRSHRATHSVEVELCAARDLILNQPTDGERRLVGIGFGVERGCGIPSVNATRDVNEAQVGKPLLQTDLPRFRIIKLDYYE